MWTDAELDELNADYKLLQKENEELRYKVAYLETIRAWCKFCNKCRASYTDGGQLFYCVNCADTLGMT
jgi:hypothetical protein